MVCFPTGQAGDSQGTYGQLIAPGALGQLAKADFLVIEKIGALTNSKHILGGVCAGADVFAEDAFQPLVPRDGQWGCVPSADALETTLAVGSSSVGVEDLLPRQDGTDAFPRHRCFSGSSRRSEASEKCRSQACRVQESADDDRALKFFPSPQWNLFAATTSLPDKVILRLRTQLQTRTRSRERLESLAQVFESLNVGASTPALPLTSVRRRFRLLGIGGRRLLHVSKRVIMVLPSSHCLERLTQMASWVTPGYKSLPLRRPHFDFLWERRFVKLHTSVPPWQEV